MGKNLPVYFGDNNMDMNLYHSINARCKHISQSSWMKNAAIEKIERENQSTLNNQQSNRQQSINMTNAPNNLLDRF